jgi:hypothetical protein
MNPRSFRRPGLLALVCAVIPSCSLPTAAEWKQIQTVGLIPYLRAKNASSKPKTQTVARSPYFANPFDSQYHLQPQPAVAVTPPYRAPSVAYAPKSAPMKHSAPAAKPAPAAPMAKPIPAVAVRPTPKPQPAVKREVVTNETAKIARVEPKKKAPEPKKKVTAPEPKKTPPTLAASAPAKPKLEPTTPPKLSAPAPTPNLPYGKPIPNRPGMVNSPFAAPHQLVDVGGLRPGQEVKCPYSGKLFLVPGAATASAPAEKKEP